jgi:hypothetical protein
MFLQKPRALFTTAPSSRFVFALVFVLHGAYALGAGLINSPDSGTYSRWANQLIAVGFNYADYAKAVSFVIPPLFYAGWVTLVAAIKIVSGPYWQQAIVFINLLANCGVAVLIVNTTYRITRHSGAAWFALLLFCIAFDIFNWIRYVLSDCTFLWLSFAIFYLLSCLLIGDGSKEVQQSAKPRKTLPLLLLSLGVLCPLALMWRPTGIILFSLLIASGFLGWRLRQGRFSQKKQSRPASDARRRAISVGLTLLSVLALWIGHGAIVQQPERWPAKALSNAIRRSAEDYSKGIVIHGRNNTYHAAPKSLPDYVAISADKFKHYFHPTHPSFSRSHKLLSLLFFVQVYLFSSIALGLWLTAKTGLGRREEAVVTLLFGCVLIFALFHSVTQLDYDWRYRLPILPHLIVIAATGFAMLCRKRAHS